MDFIVAVSGFLLGLVTGLIPGLHPNTILPILQNAGISPDVLSLILILMVPAYLVSALIPAIFLGVPEKDNPVAVLPGQRLLRSGLGIVALKVALLSMLLSSLIAVAIFSLTFDFYSSAYSLIHPYVKFILLAFTLLLLFKSKNPIFSFVIFVASGALGSFSFGLKISDPFLPLFAGMFSVAAMVSTRFAARIPDQKDESISSATSDLQSKHIILYIILGVVLGLLADLLPGVGSPSQIAAIASIAVPFQSLNYLAATTAISASQIIFSLSTSVAINKTRVGPTAWLDKSMDIGGNLTFILTLFLISLALSTLIVYLARKKVAQLSHLDFGIVRLVLPLYLAAITFVIDGPTGLAVLGIGVLIGVLALRLEVERTMLMGAIIFPTLMLLFRFFI